MANEFKKSVGPVYDKQGKHHFAFSAPLNRIAGERVALLEVGKILKPGNDPKMKVGDKIYITVSFHVTSATNTLTGKNISNYVKFYSQADDEYLDVTVIVESFKFNAGEVTFDCFLDLSNLKSGEKKIDILGYNLDNGKTEEVYLGSSDVFYLHQSIVDFMQPNIANGGIAESIDASNLAREKMGNAAYFPVGLQPVNPLITKDVQLWESIRDVTESLSFRRYLDFMNVLFCGENRALIGDKESDYLEELALLNNRRKLPFNDTDSYRAIKVATEAFVMVNLANSNKLVTNYLEKVSDSEGRVLKIIPYLSIIRHKLNDVDFKSTSIDETLERFVSPNNTQVVETCYGIIADRIQSPIYMELIWSYWHEECMMVQGVNTITRRFQNIKGEGAVDPLANLEIGPLRPLSNLMWGYIQDEQHRLTVRRRAYEYDHHYGITLQGKAVSNMRTADSRSKFIEAFHVLLNLCIKFYHQYDDTTVVADGFPIMNALKEVHMILSEGAHNQFGDLPYTARIEMLMQQYLLARPEFREFLPTRQMVPYPEAWMDRAAVLNQLHGWTKTSVLHFRDLGVFGEQIILSIRFGAWSTAFNRDQAANWAIFWRPQIQNYIHAYRAVTSVDLAREDSATPIDAQQPSIHLLRRLKEQNGKIKL